MAKSKNVKIKGRIIRILDETTVIVNLGLRDGVGASSVFSILGTPEEVVDPITKESLGTVLVVKGRVKANSVSERFTIATSKWIERTSRFTGLSFGGYEESAEEHDSKLRIQSSEVKPWKAVSAEFVRVGDEVETSVTISIDEEPPSEQATTSAGATDPA